ncbi:hypothetical protein [uncultured Methylobacterium sp.]|uniref:hypothetical protein n=1 Tax=uncultured Methylobacterium sp. TaxID=157278 RepID=UPI0035CB7F2B
MSATLGRPRLTRTVTGLLRRLTLGRVPTLFDTAYYLRTYPDAAASSLDPFLHYVLLGARRDYDPNADFDTPFYRAQGIRTRLDPLRHYLTIGAAAGYDPHPRFSTRSYLNRYPDVVAVKANPLQHYREHGRPEKRAAEPSKLVPRSIVALAGVPSAHHWTLPDRDGGGIRLALLRGAPEAPGAERVERLCLSLCLTFEAVDDVVQVLAHFPTGVQDAVRLDVAADPGTAHLAPSLLVALDHCYLQPAAPDGARTVSYAQAVLWDLRPEVPRVITNVPHGALRVRASGGQGLTRRHR